MPQMHGGREQAAPNESRSIPLLCMTSTHTRRTTTDKHFKIMQHNVAKRHEVMDSILNDKLTKDYSLLMVQEHYHYKSNPLLHQSWMLIEPTTIRDTPPRSAIYINNKKLLPTLFEQVIVPNAYITAISINLSALFNKPILIVNLYNPQQQPIINELRQILLQGTRIQDYDVVIVAGDFNLHHP